MSENMGKDELKSRVCHWYTECNQRKILKNIIYDVLREKQALDMVLNLIKSYDPDTAAWMNRCHELEIKLAQKPKVEAGEVLFGSSEHRAQLARVIDGLCDEIKEHVTSILQTEDKPKVSREWIENLIYIIEEQRGATTLSTDSFRKATDEIMKEFESKGIEVGE